MQVYFLTEYLNLCFLNLTIALVRSVLDYLLLLIVQLSFFFFNFLFALLF